MYREFYESLLRQAGGSWFDFEGLIRDIYVALLRPGDVALDAGAHQGDHTFQMAQAVAPNGRVIAIEAAPELIKELRALAEDHYPHLAGIVDIRGIGLSDKPGKGAFYYAPDTPGLSGLRKRDHVLQGPVVELEVELTTLDDICRSVPRPIRFMKIDIEGAEYHALRGGTQTILQDRPVIVFEHNQESPRHFCYSPEDLVRLFRSLDYHIYDFFHNPYDEFEPWRDTLMWNFLALPEGHPQPEAIFEAVRRSLASIGVRY